MAEEHGLEVDVKEYEESKRKAVEISSAGGEKLQQSADLDVHAIAELQSRGVPTTDDSPKYQYVDDGKRGLEAQYDFAKCTGKIVALRKNGTFADELNTGEEGVLILDKTSFYAEQGGQIYDTGVLSKVGEEGTEFTVTNVQIRGGYVIFVGVAEGTLHVGDEVEQTFDEPRRWLIMKNHTGTHVLNYSLERVIGSVDQKGSLVAPDRMRFDFTSKQGLTAKQVKEIEETAQKLIDTHNGVYAKPCKLDDAKQINGLRAVFDEAYPDPVRVVSIGVPVDDLLANPQAEHGKNTSVEFCGGTHLKNVGHIGHLVIATEEAIAKGIRRIVALTGPEAERALARADRLEVRAKELNQRIKGNESIVADRAEFKKTGKEINEFIQEVNQSLLPYWRKDSIRELAKGAQKLLDSYERQAKAAIEKKVLSEAQDINKDIAHSFLVHIFSPGANPKALDSALKAITKPSAVMGFSVNDDKVLVAAKVNKDVASNGLSATEWVRKVCEIAGGKSGGRDIQAQAACEHVDRIDKAVEAAKEFATMSLSS
jgi:alanyl-tRNA synthetase